MASFAEQIKNFSSPKPTNFDPDEDDFDTTRATLVNKDNLHDEEAEILVPSSLRKKTITLLAEEDKKYQGRRVSRNDLALMRGDFIESDEGEEDLDNEDDKDTDMGINQEDMNYSDGDQDVSEDVISDNDASNDDEESDGGNDDDASDDDNASNDDDASDDDDEDDDEGGDMLSKALEENNNKTSGFQSFSQSKLEEEVEKGICVKHQLNLWDTFLEYRIRLQKSMPLVNKLPQHDTSDAFSSTEDGSLKPEVQQGKKALTELLYKLLIIQEKLFDQNPDTKGTLYPTGQNDAQKSSSNDDEEIPSDSEDEQQEKDTETQLNKEHSLKLPLKRKGNFSQEEFSECISKRHASFQGIRDSIITKWSEKTRFASGKLKSKSFNSFDKSAMSQIKQVLNDKQRLVKRSQLKRSLYRVLGKSDKEIKNLDNTEQEENQHLKDYDTEIFDDDDFYHQLLRELIERRTTTNSDDPIEMGRQWLELQKLRRKIKKKVDTKASKGRKLRYNVLSKLVSYMPPIERGTMPDSSRNELFSSLFGQLKPQQESCDINVFR